MFLMSSNRLAESLLRSFSKIVSTTSMSMHTNIPRNDVHATGINLFSTNQRQIAVCHFQYMIVTDQDGTCLPGTVLSAGKTGVFVACGRDGTETFRLDTVQFPGGKALSAKDAALGRKLVAGQIFASPAEAEN